MYAQMLTTQRPRQHRSFKILVIDEDPATVHLVASMVKRGTCEVIACHDMALAEVAMDLTELDLVLVAPSCTGVDGVEGLAVASFIMARNPTAQTMLMVSEQDGDLRAAAERLGLLPVLSKPLLREELLAMSSELGLPLAPTWGSLLSRKSLPPATEHALAEHA
jgi:DNA-binding NtrC family response regulator